MSPNTHQDAKDLIDRNSADDNNAYMKLAERIIQQQDPPSPAPPRSWTLRFLILAGTAVFLGPCAWLVRSLRVNSQHP
jgi:hypothetical protein